MSLEMTPRLRAALLAASAASAEADADGGVAYHERLRRALGAVADYDGIPEADLACVEDELELSDQEFILLCVDFYGLESAAREDTPSDPAWQEPCPDLEREYQAFADDPITSAYGLESEMAPALTRQHVARHHCQGWGRA